MQTLDLLDGTTTMEIDLATVPFLSRYGPSEGTLEIVTEAGGRVVDLKISQFSSRRVLFRELDRIASEANWEVPVETIRLSQAPRFVLDLELRAEGRQRLADVEIRLEPTSLGSTLSALRPLFKDKHYQVANIREVVGGR